MMADAHSISITEHPVFTEFKQMVRTIRAEVSDPKKKHHVVYIQAEFDKNPSDISFREMIDACFYVGEASNATERAACHFITSTAIRSNETKSVVSFS